MVPFLGLDLPDAVTLRRWCEALPVAAIGIGRCNLAGVGAAKYLYKMLAR